ncbi:MAG: SIMPL domain-containing protein [Patescibacteria group bacterium]
METTGFLHSNHNRWLGTLVLVMIVIALGAYAKLTLEQAGQVSYPGSITVIGEGEINATPDIGRFSFSVTAQADTAAAAQEASGTKINAILAYLKEQGVAEKDIKSGQYYSNPRWRHEERPCVFGSYCPPSEPIQDGFEVSQTVTVKVRELDNNNTGKIIAGVGELGATNISDLSFTVDDTDALRAEARETAIADAKAKAEVLAKQLGVKLTRMTSYYENQDGFPYPMFEKSVAQDAAGGFGGPELPVGEQTTKVIVNVTYEFK